MKITIIGGGYVGLVSGACFATFGASVTIVECNPSRFAQLKAGHVPIYEPGLDELFTQEVQRGTLRFSKDTAEALSDSEAVFIAVGTPTRRGSGHADLSYVYAVANDIARLATHPLLVVTKSTVPVGTGREVSRILKQQRPDLNFHVASNPEFLREGSAIEDFLKPDRVLIGLDQYSDNKGEYARNFLSKLYHPLTQPRNRLTFMGLESAELTKYASNAFLAMKVTFANEMADICEATGADITEVTHGMGQDPRISPHFLTPGPGYGGSCFPKDTRALATSARQAGAPTQLIETTISANEARKQRLAERILNLLGQPLYTKTVAVLGLTFKANTDDMREAPALRILPALYESGIRLQLFDPQGVEQARPLLPQGVHYAESALAATENADAVLILTEWPTFKTLTPKQLRSTMNGRLILDFRGIWKPTLWHKAGFTYHGLGHS